MSGPAAVAVSVATVWRAPEAVRPVDAPALAVPADPRGWVAAMTRRDKLDLHDRAETQVLYGDPVVVLEERAGWSRVFVPGQASGRDPGGYPGWLPTPQLTEPLGSEADGVVVVATTVTRLHAQPGPGRGSVELSFGTRLPVADRAPDWVGVAVPGSGVRWLMAAAVEPAGVADAGTSGDRLLLTAAGFLGLPYLWAGVSAYGFDCSGLVHAVHRRHGVTIPRDADDQARGGQPVPLDAVEPGDLVFFAGDSGRGQVHHVAMYAGADSMLHAPDTGRTVELTQIDTRHYAGELCAARRYR